MTAYDNPAGRLHAILTRFNMEGTRSIVDAWATVLRVEPDRVPYWLGKLRDLVEETRRAAIDTDEKMFERVPKLLEPVPRTIFPTGQAWTNPAGPLAADQLLMQALEMLSDYLRDRSPDDELPDEGRVAELITEVRELIGAVTDSDIEPAVKRLLLNHLNEVLEALEHLDLGGPEAVRSAALALGATARVYQETAKRHPALDRIKKFVVVTYVAFIAGAPISNAEVGWEHIVQDMIGAPAQVRQLPPGAPHAEKSPPPDADDR